MYKATEMYHTDMIIKTFSKRGYKKEPLEKLSWMISKGYRRDGDRIEMHRREQGGNSMNFAIVLDYNWQYREVKDVIEKYWPILQKDSVYYDT